MDDQHDIFTLFVLVRVSVIEALVLAHSCFNSYAPELVPIYYSPIKHGTDVLFLKYIGLQAENTCSCTNPFMWNGGCEHSLCARVPRAWHGLCQIRYESIPRGLSFLKIIKCGVYDHCKMRTSRRNDSCHQTSCSAFNRRHFNIQILWVKYLHTGSIEDLRRLPKRRVTTPLQDIQIVNDRLQDRFTVTATTARNTVGRHSRAIHPQCAIV